MTLSPLLALLLKFYIRSNLKQNITIACNISKSIKSNILSIQTYFCYFVQSYVFSLPKIFFTCHMRLALPLQIGVYTNERRDLLCCLEIEQVMLGRSPSSIHVHLFLRTPYLFCSISPRMQKYLLRFHFRQYGIKNQKRHLIQRKNVYLQEISCT